MRLWARTEHRQEQDKSELQARRQFKNAMQDVADARITLHGTVRTLLPTTMVWDLLVGKTYRKGETTNDTQPKGLSPTGYPFFGWTYTKESQHNPPRWRVFLEQRPSRFVVRFLLLHLFCCNRLNPLFVPCLSVLILPDSKRLSQGFDGKLAWKETVWIRF